MIKLQTFSDKTAIGLSLACSFHCLALPLILVLFPSVASLQLDNESFHLWMILAVIPTSLYALTLGCKKHKRYYLLIVGGFGLTSLMLAAFLPELLIGELGEKVFTVLGAGFIAFGHYKNYRLCQVRENCMCSDAKKNSVS